MLVRFLIYTAVLYAGLVHNVFCVQEDVITMSGVMRSGHSPGDDALAINRMRRTEEGPWGSMAAWNGTGWTPYRSQFGLTGILMAAVQRASGCSPERVAALTSAGMGLLTALLLAAFFTSVAARIAPLAGHMGALGSACCTPLLNFAPSLYWTLPASLAPFVFAWIAYPRMAGSSPKWIAFIAIDAVLVCVKGLCGYEYISSVVAAPAAAVVYHRCAAGFPARRWILPVMAVGVAGCLGFGASIGLHAAQISSLTGEKGFETIRERAAARTSTSEDLKGERVAYPMLAPETLPGPTRHFANYYYQTILSSPQTWGRVRFGVPLGVLAVVSLLASVILWRRRESDRAAAALAPATLVAFLASASWQLLAINHMVLHGHLNLIVYCIPFAPLAFVAVGAAVSGVVRARGTTVLLTLTAAASIGWNLVPGEGAGANQARAEERVRKVLQGEADAEPHKGPELVVRDLPVDPGHLPGFAVFSPAYGPSDDGEPLVGVYGLIRLNRERSGRTPITVVIVRGLELVPSRVGLFRLVGFERQMKNQETFAAFHAVLPLDSRPLRVFAVPHDTDQPVFELTSRR